MKILISNGCGVFRRVSPGPRASRARLPQRRRGQFDRRKLGDLERPVFLSPGRAHLQADRKALLVKARGHGASRYAAPRAAPGVR